MAHNHGSEYQVRVVRGDGTEELIGWLNSAEQVAQEIDADSKQQGKAYWVQGTKRSLRRLPKQGTENRGMSPYG